MERAGVFGGATIGKQRVNLPTSVQIPPHLIDREAVQLLISQSAPSRLRHADPNLWGKKAASEANSRLGWIDAINRVEEVTAQALRLREDVSGLSYEQVLLCGMGGSSLAPQVITHGSEFPLIPLDTIHPDAVGELCTIEQLSRSVIVVSSKSGGTSETRTQLALCEALLRDAGQDPADRIIVITDPDSELEEHARLRGYRTVLGDPLVGGRYSALTVFGIIPAVLAGVDEIPGRNDLRAAAELFAANTHDNPAVQLAAALYTAHEQHGVLQIRSGEHPGLALWVEQLIAESTGKDGMGLLPLVRDQIQPTDTGGPIVTLYNSTADDGEQPESTKPSGISVTANLAVHFYLWEVTTALLCMLSGVNPFDQPDVERTKKAARRMRPGQLFPDSVSQLAEGIEVTVVSGVDAPSGILELAETLLTSVDASSYTVIQAFLPQPSTLLEELAGQLEQLTGTPTTVSYGPEYLHSTGQLHKGGQPDGFFLHLFGTPLTDIKVPGTITSFAWLCAAASLADQQVLSELDRSVIGLRIETVKVLNQLIEHLPSRF